MVGNCARCGAHGELKQVTVLRSIGMVIAVSFRSVGGTWCRPCIDAELGPATLTTAALGWWSITGLFLTPFFLALNFATFLRTRGMELPTTPGALLASPPAVTASPGSSAPSAPLGAPPQPEATWAPPAAPVPAAAWAPPAATVPAAFTGTSAPEATPAAGSNLWLWLLASSVPIFLGGLLMTFFAYKWAFGTDPRDAQFSPFCLAMSFLVCVLPGLAGAGYGLFRARARG